MLSDAYVHKCQKRSKDMVSTEKCYDKQGCCYNFKHILIHNYIQQIEPSNDMNATSSNNSRQGVEERRKKRTKTNRLVHTQARASCESN